MVLQFGVSPFPAQGVAGLCATDPLPAVAADHFVYASLQPIIATGFDD